MFDVCLFYALSFQIALWYREFWPITHVKCLNLNSKWIIVVFTALGKYVNIKLEYIQFWGLILWPPTAEFNCSDRVFIKSYWIVDGMFTYCYYPYFFLIYYCMFPLLNFPIKVHVQLVYHLNGGGPGCCYVKQTKSPEHLKAIRNIYKKCIKCYIKLSWSV